ncbi:MAG: rhodanese-like domain-containing protein [Pseudomonadota bacterium]
MSTDTSPRVEKLLPTETWDYLKTNSDAVLVDVRTKPEWGFVGKPDLSSLGQQLHCICWAEYPDMSINPGFVDAVRELVVGDTVARAFFLCRSGVRSQSAAEAVSSAFFAEGLPMTCVNVVEGFEGDLDAEHKRGGLNGWKARGLPWRQS